MPSSATGSPGSSATTPPPTSATSPAISWPGQTDGIIIWSWYQCRSEPQMPQLRTRTTTSPGPGTGRGTSSTTSLPTARQKAARMVGTGASYSDGAAPATKGPQVFRSNMAGALATGGGRG